MSERACGVTDSSRFEVIPSVLARRSPRAPLRRSNAFCPCFRTTTMGGVRMKPMTPAELHKLLVDAVAAAHQELASVIGRNGPGDRPGARHPHVGDRPRDPRGEQDSRGDGRPWRRRRGHSRSAAHGSVRLRLPLGRTWQSRMAAARQMRWAAMTACSRCRGRAHDAHVVRERRTQRRPQAAHQRRPAHRGRFTKSSRPPPRWASETSATPLIASKLRRHGIIRRPGDGADLVQHLIDDEALCLEILRDVLRRAFTRCRHDPRLALRHPPPASKSGIRRKHAPRRIPKITR